MQKWSCSHARRVFTVYIYICVYICVCGGICVRYIRKHFSKHCHHKSPNLKTYKKNCQVFRYAAVRHFGSAPESFWSGKAPGPPRCLVALPFSLPPNLVETPWESMGHVHYASILATEVELRLKGSKCLCFFDGCPFSSTLFVTYLMRQEIEHGPKTDGNG